MKDTKVHMITLSIDGKQVNAPAGTSILHAARMAGIYIPTLCYLECLPDYGGCRLCMVEVEHMRGSPTACTTPIAKDMKISTRTEELQKLRREILELILSEHPYTCLVCRDKKECTEFMHSTRKVNTTTGCNFCTSNGDCDLQDLVEYLDLKEVRFPMIYRNLPPVKDNPFYDLDYNLCILCGRCVRICNEERFSEVLAFVERGNSALVGTAFNETQKEAGCEYCGACVDVCPTGSISEKMGSWVGLPDRSTTTHCSYCSIACEMNVNTKGNRIINVGPEPGKRDDPPQLCVRGKFVPGDITHHPERVKSPHIKKNGRWIEVKWEEAIKHIADNLIKFKGAQFGLIGSAHDSIENSFVLQKFARQTMKSGNADIYPSPAYNTIIRDIHDYYAAHGHVVVDDILEADKIYVIGSEAQWSHPIIENRIRKAYKAGKEVIVANSTANRTVNFSTSFHQYKKGHAHAFLQQLMQELTDEKVNEKFVMVIGDEVLGSDQAEENLRMLMSINTLPGTSCKILFLMAEGNRYGATMAGMNPALLSGFSTAKKKGLSSWEMLKKQKVISALYLVGDVPDTRSLAGLKFFVQQNMFFTPASEHAHVFLPLENNMESDGHILNLEGKIIQLSPVIKRDEYVLPTYQAVSKIAKTMNTKGFDYKSTKSIYKEIQVLIEGSLHRGQKIKISDGKVPALTAKSKNGHLTKELLEKYHFHYMGNKLTDLIPDLKEVLEE